jgi:hypothetical protein
MGWVMMSASPPAKAPAAKVSVTLMCRVSQLSFLVLQVKEEEPYLLALLFCRVYQVPYRTCFKELRPPILLRIDTR